MWWKKKKAGHIPTVLDRFIQQAILQVLQRYIDPSFSDNSYGFRPKKSAIQSIEKSKHYVAEGYSIVVDIDLEQFFDRVNQDKLMSELFKRIKDSRVLKLIRSYLNSGSLVCGMFVETKEGCPQGGPLSPFLSNIILDLLDKELESRGHKHVRYTDNCNIYVKSRKSGERVKKSITHFITRKLKLQVNETKSAVD
ncbi:MAG: group II intron reverse transcriptase/maturase, partial [Amoebophilaceae bacterium]|nr:group II intron reverse transcriptase/maturase [Amoebophilaceae bacterium]